MNVFEKHFRLKCVLHHTGSHFIKDGGCQGDSKKVGTFITGWIQLVGCNKRTPTLQLPPEHKTEQRNGNVNAASPFWSGPPFQGAFFYRVIVSRVSQFSLTTAESVCLSHQSQLAVWHPSGSVFCRFMPVWLAGTSSVAWVFSISWQFILLKSGALKGDVFFIAGIENLCCWGLKLVDATTLILPCHEPLKWLLWNTAHCFTYYLKSL